MKLGEISAEQASLRRNKQELLDCIKIPAGHLLSVIVEEIGIENPDVRQMIHDWNFYISKYIMGLDIKDPEETILYASSKRIFGLFDYIRQLKRDLNLNEDTYRRLRARIEDEIKGIVPEDRVFERKKHPFLNMYS